MRYLAASLVAWVDLACSELMELRLARSLLCTDQAWYSTVPTIPWVRLMPAAYNLGGVSSSSDFWMLSPYIIL